MGCTVRAFDPTVTRPDHIKSPWIHFRNVGIAQADGWVKDPKYEVKTLNSLIKDFGDQGKPITYLKLDVEGDEHLSFDQMIKSGVLKNVKQIGVEMHTSVHHWSKKSIKKLVRSTIRNFQFLHKDLDFRMVSYNGNGCHSKLPDHTKQYYSYHDVLFVKVPK
jgi:hypothetical protein